MFVLHMRASFEPWSEGSGIPSIRPEHSYENILFFALSTEYTGYPPLNVCRSINLKLSVTSG